MEKATLQQKATLRNSKIGKRYLPWKPKSITQTRQDVKDRNQALNLYHQEEDPQNWRLQEMYSQVVDLDGTVTSQKENRDSQVFSAGFNLKKPNGDVDEEQTKALKKMPIYRFLTQAVLDARDYGYSVVELTMKRINDKMVLTPELIPRTNVVPQRGKFYPDYTDITRSIDYRDMPEFGVWILEFNTGIGLYNKLLIPALFNRFLESCWSELCEIYGIPPRVMKTNTQDSSMLKRAETMMRDMGAASWFIIDETEEFEFAKGVSTNGDVYNNLLKLLRNKICSIISGGLIGQDTENGNRAKDEVVNDLLWLRVQSDMAMLEEAWNTKIIPCLQKHGIIKGDVTFEFEEAEDIGQLWKFVQGLKDTYEIDIDWIKQKFGVEVTGPKNQGNNQPSEGELSATINKVIKNQLKGFFEQLNADPDFFHQAPASRLRSRTRTGANQKGCCGNHLTLAALPKGAPKSDSLIQRIADAKGELVFDPETFEATSKTLIKGFNKGLDGRKIKLATKSNNFPKVPNFGKVPNKATLAAETAYGIDDPHLLTAFELNLFRFSAGKTMAEVQALNEAFRNAKNFDIFQMNANRIGDVWNKTWLQTEWDTAILTGESATNYHSLTRDVETFPFWEYRTVGDGNVRAEHAKLDGLILPANDPRWKQIFPPNGWNCRCTVVARTREEVEGVDFKAQRKRVDDYFGTDEFERAAAQGWGVNRAIEGEVFTANQQYIVGKNLTQTRKQLNNLSAQDYGLKAYAERKAMAKSNVPQYEGTAQEWFDQLDTLNEKQTVYDYNQRALRVDPENFQKHTTGSKAKRVKLIKAMEEVLSKPDEVWLRGKRKTSKMNDMVYLKYYQDKTIIVIGEQKESNIVELETWFTLTEKESIIESYRRGILVKK